MGFWMRFCSREVKDIVAHFMPEENAACRTLGQKEASRFGAAIAAPGALVVVMVSHSIARHFPLTSSLEIVALLTMALPPIEYALAYTMRARMRAFLCSTRYAQQAGSRPETLRLYLLGVS